jgi:hypothetical protein
MYSEKTFKNYIFWIQVKRVVIIILFCCIGSALGVLIGSIFNNATKINFYSSLTIVISTLMFFVLSLLLTSGIGKEVQDAYWKIALLRKLTAMQKEIKINNEILYKAQVKKTESKNTAKEKNVKQNETEIKRNILEKTPKAEKMKTLKL